MFCCAVYQSSFIVDLNLLEMNMTENDADNFNLAGEIAAETVISSSEVDFYNHQDSCTVSIRMKPSEYLENNEHTEIKTNNDVLWQKIEGQQGSQDNINDPVISQVPKEQLVISNNQEKGLTMASKRERNKVKKREQRLNPEFREKERIKARERMKERREDTRYRDCERQKDRERRKLFRKRMNYITHTQDDLNFVQNDGHIYLESDINVQQSPCEIDQSHQGYPSDIIDQSHQGYPSDITGQSKQRTCTIDNNSQLDQLCENSVTNNDQSLHIQYETDQNFISVSTGASGRTIRVENQFNLSEVYS
ncbi:uncharacterized protein LOC126811007 isoform X2 [Patella vulgata]|uniref:uncharacterized protein LOC126811007 isoform X2 n=1 Tax=Patella vulgata TaxID=6465 RepID=UPI0021807CB4|nr:uncharacterized protein LOC126811007 isoform X2 [Patella vulgata]